MPHLYLHVPFCVRRCSYCDFSIAVRKRIPAREYVEAVLRELEQVRAADPGAVPRGALKTLYLGGGTPSLLPPDAVSTLLTSLLDAFGATPSRDAVEVTAEANPEDVTPELASVWRRAGVNRVSLGAQSFDDRVLRWMHRSHGAARGSTTSPSTSSSPCRRSSSATGSGTWISPSPFSLLTSPCTASRSRSVHRSPAGSRAGPWLLRRMTGMQTSTYWHTCALRRTAIVSTRSRMPVTATLGRVTTPPTGPADPISGSAPRRTATMAARVAGTSPPGRPTPARSRRGALRSSPERS